MSPDAAAVTPVTARSTLYRWNIVLLLATSQMLAYVDRVNLSVAGPVLIKEYHYTPATLGVFTNNRWYDPATGSHSIANQGNADNNLAQAMLAHLRSERPLGDPNVLPTGVTDLRLYRVAIDSAITGLRLQP